MEAGHGNQLIVQIVRKNSEKAHNRNDLIFVINGGVRGEKNEIDGFLCKMTEN
jgi:hypothetical protein